MKRDWTDFKTIYGNIEGARKGVEDACGSLFRLIYESEHVGQIRLVKGDYGVDVYVGDFGIKPIIVIQCKIFLKISVILKRTRYENLLIQQ